MPVYSLVALVKRLIPLLPINKNGRNYKGKKSYKKFQGD
jgi:hypothetical protein